MKITEWEYRTMEFEYEVEPESIELEECDGWKYDSRTFREDRSDPYRSPFTIITVTFRRPIEG